MLRSDVSLDGQQRDSKHHWDLCMFYQQNTINGRNYHSHSTCGLFKKNPHLVLLRNLKLLPAVHAALMSEWSVHACISASLQLVTAAL